MLPMGGLGRRLRGGVSQSWRRARLATGKSSTDGQEARMPWGVLCCASVHLRPAAGVEEGGMEDREEGRQEERERENGGREREIERQREEVGGREGDGDVKRREYKE